MLIDKENNLLIENKDNVLIIKKTQGKVSFELLNGEEFIIDETNYGVYISFIKLYDSIIDASIVPFEDPKIYEGSWYQSHGYSYDEYLKRVREINEFLKEKDEYKNLVKDDKIIWKEDSTLEVLNLEDKIALKIHGGSISISDDNPKYKSFYIPFFHLYDELKKRALEEREEEFEKFLEQKYLKRVRGKLCNM